MAENINELVARRLGYPIMDGGSNSAAICTDFDKGVPVRCIPDYCHSIQAAWEIMEHMPNGSVGKNYWGKWICSYGIMRTGGYYVEEADTAPMAICLAFLNLEEGK